MDNIDIPPEWQYKAAVHWACSSCNPEITRIILSHGIDVNRLDQDGHMGPFYMLDIGNQENTIEVLELLLQAGLEINKKTPNSSSILSDYVSSITKPLKIIEWLLAHGADMNEKMNNNGPTIYEFMCRSYDLRALANRYKAIEEPNQVKIISRHNSLEFMESKNEQPIFEYLYNKFGPSFNSIDIVSNSNPKESNNFPKMILGPKRNNYVWISKDIPNSYIEIKFKHLVVQLTKYKIQVGNNSEHNTFNSWTLLGKTTDGQEIIIDEVSASPDIYDGHTEAVFNVDSNDFIHSIKLIMNGKNTNGDFRMLLQNIEIYGIMSYLY